MLFIGVKSLLITGSSQDGNAPSPGEDSEEIDGAGSSSIENVLERFELIKGLRHPNLCPYIEAVLGKGNELFLVAWHHPTTLAAVVESLGPGDGWFGEGTILQLILDLASGLNFMHDHGLVHRGLAPALVLFPAPGRPAALADFGSFHVTQQGRVLAGPIGTIAFCAPEVILQRLVGQDVGSSPCADAWSLGALLFFLLRHGCLPWGGAAGAAGFEGGEPAPAQVAEGILQFCRLLPAPVRPGPGPAPGPSGGVDPSGRDPVIARPYNTADFADAFLPPPPPAAAGKASTAAGAGPVMALPAGGGGGGGGGGRGGAGWDFRRGRSPTPAVGGGRGGVEAAQASAGLPKQLALLPDQLVPPDQRVGWSFGIVRAAHLLLDPDWRARPTVCRLLHNPQEDRTFI